MAEPKIISIEVIGSSGQESPRLRALEVGGRRKDEMCSILSKELLTTKVPLTFVSTRDTTKQIISMTSVSVMFALRSCETLLDQEVRIFAGFVKQVWKVQILPLFYSLIYLQ